MPDDAASGDGPKRRGGREGRDRGMMRTIETTAIVGTDGRLSVEHAVDVPAGQHRIVLMIDDKVEPDDHERYPPGFFEETYGSLADDPLPLMPEGDNACTGCDE